MAQSSGTRSRVLSLRASRQASTASISPLCATLALPERAERVAEVVLYGCPLERHVIECQLFERLAVDLDGFEQTSDTVLALTEHAERVSEKVPRAAPSSS